MELLLFFDTKNIRIPMDTGSLPEAEMIIPAGKNEWWRILLCLLLSA